MLRSVATCLRSWRLFRGNGARPRPGTNVVLRRPVGPSDAAFTTALLTLIGTGASNGRDAVEAALGNAQGATGIERMMRAAAIFPAATLAADHRPFVVLSADATGALLVAPDSDGHARFATWPQVGEALGLAPEAVAPWVVGERETGLDGMRGGPGAPHGLPPLQRLLAWVRLERDDVGWRWSTRWGSASFRSPRRSACSSWSTPWRSARSSSLWLSSRCSWPRASLSQRSCARSRRTSSSACNSGSSRASRSTWRSACRVSSSMRSTAATAPSS